MTTEIPSLNIQLPTTGASRTWMSPVEDAFSYLYMDTPFKRLFLGGGAVAVLLYWLKPQGYFEGDQPRPWALWSQSPDAILFPWWLTAGLIGLFLAVFV